MMSSKVIKGVVSIPVAFALHEYLPILGVIFAALHALVLMGDAYIGFTPWQLLIPFTSSYKPFWTGLGVLAFYLFVALIASFYGMNVPIYGENMPHGFAIIVMISITLSALSFFIFRKIKWF